MFFRDNRICSVWMPLKEPNSKCYGLRVYPVVKKYVSSLFFKIWINNIHYFLLYTIFYARALLQGIWTRVSCHHARALLPGTSNTSHSHIHICSDAQPPITLFYIFFFYFYSHSYLHKRMVHNMTVAYEMYDITTVNNHHLQGVPKIIEHWLWVISKFKKKHQKLFWLLFLKGD